jgi:hypothetical protein
MALGVVGCTVAGAAAGGLIGVLYGEATDTGDFPMGVLLGFPGALIGGLVGCIAGALAFT